MDGNGQSVGAQSKSRAAFIGQITSKQQLTNIILQVYRKQIVKKPHLYQVRTCLILRMLNTQSTRCINNLRLGAIFQTFVRHEDQQYSCLIYFNFDYSWLDCVAIVYNRASNIHGKTTINVQQPIRRFDHNLSMLWMVLQAVNEDFWCQLADANSMNGSE